MRWDQPVRARGSIAQKHRQQLGVVPALQGPYSSIGGIPLPPSPAALPTSPYIGIPRAAMAVRPRVVSATQPRIERMSYHLTNRRGWMSLALVAALSALPFHSASIHNAYQPNPRISSTRGKGKGRGIQASPWPTRRSQYAPTGRARPMKGHANRKRHRANFRRARARRTANR